MKPINEPIIVEEIINAPIKTVWNAITQVVLMRQWFFDNIPDFKAEVGFKTQFNVQSESRNFLHLWTVTEVKFLKKIVCNWKYEDYEGDSFVHFELIEEKNSTIIRVKSIVTENFTDDIPEFKPESCRAGWNYFIKQNLKNYLEKTT